MRFHQVLTVFLLVCPHLVTYQVSIFSLNKMRFPTGCHSILGCAVAIIPEEKFWFGILKVTFSPLH